MSTEYTSPTGKKYTNTFGSILDTLRLKIRTEFKGALPTYIGHEQENLGTQYLRLDPIRNELLEYSINGEIREYNISLIYYFSEPNINRTALDHVLRTVSRIEALVHDEMDMSLTTSIKCFNCRIENTSFNVSEKENEYVVEMDWRGQHQGNLS